MAPPEGPARIALDPEGFVALPPDAGSLARDAVVLGVIVLVVVATLASIVALLTRGVRGLLCLVLLSPAIVSSVATPPARRLLLAWRGAHRVRCTPSELVVDYGGGEWRVPLAEVRDVYTPAAGQVVVGGEMIELAASAGQTEWLAGAIAAAAERARRIPEPPPPPAALESLRR